MKFNTLMSALSVTALMTFSGIAFAEQNGHAEHSNEMHSMEHHDDHTSMDHSHSEDSTSTAAYKAVNDAMHSEMLFDYTGDPDADFIIGMIAHHEGAIEMAKVVLEYGKDPEIRKLAEDIISAQEKEITWMKEWLENNGY